MKRQSNGNTANLTWRKSQFDSPNLGIFLFLFKLVIKELISKKKRTVLEAVSKVPGPATYSQGYSMSWARGGARHTIAARPLRHQVNQTEATDSLPPKSDGWMGRNYGGLLLKAAAVVSVIVCTSSIMASQTSKHPVVQIAKGSSSGTDGDKIGILVSNFIEGPPLPPRVTKVALLLPYCAPLSWRSGSKPTNIPSSELTKKTGMRSEQRRGGGGGCWHGGTGRGCDVIIHETCCCREYKPA